ncbi:MAG: pantoate--beta-alanine ligase [Nitrospinae bacterium]|nr:pantoate--beta-alanine ligase [Nitrospinota bacterium]
MEIIETVRAMQARSEEWRAAGETVALVPTMGAFHEAHLNLMGEGRRRADRLVVSLFVNPTQFGPGEDYEAYPRNLEADLKATEDIGVDVLYHPSAEEMYPEGYASYVEVEGLTDTLCGPSRPGHFRGVATVVAKLFTAVKPHVAIFGEKDFQQLAVIRRMVADLHLEIEIVGVPIVREADGLAMSSRNLYLSAEERRTALGLSSSLVIARQMILDGERDVQTIEEKLRSHIEAAGPCTIDYVAVADQETMALKETIDGPLLIALAVRVGSARLIDNTVIEPPASS